MERFPSGQREQTVNLLSVTSVVRIHPSPPEKALISSAFSFTRGGYVLFHNTHALRAEPPLYADRKQRKYKRIYAFVIFARSGHSQIKRAFCTATVSLQTRSVLI